MSKIHIRLFIPNTTEALNFEYGLLIQYMTYNEIKSHSEISLAYYELSTIDPMHNALDIVERKEITDTTRIHSNRPGFTLHSHYTLSFDRRYNNKIPEKSVRQVWLWLHCDDEKDLSFLVEKLTTAEELICSHNNQMLIRLWAHSDWLARDINPLNQRKINGRIALETLLRQQLSTQYDEIEQDNRTKAIAAIQSTNPNPSPAIITPVATPITPQPTPSTIAITDDTINTLVPAIDTPVTISQNTAPSKESIKPILPQQKPAKKSKNWILAILLFIIGFPLLNILGNSRKDEKSSYNSDPVAISPQTDTQTLAASAPEEETSGITDHQDIMSTDARNNSETNINQAGDLASDLIQEQDKPEIIVGLEWHSKTIDYRDPRGSLDDVTYKIISHHEGNVLIEKTITDRPDSKVTLVYDESLNLIGGKTGRYVPALSRYDFPLTIGKTWNVASKVIGNQYKDSQQASGQVLGTENISTPMGDFEAIKIVVEYTAYLEGNEVSRGQDISWYVPKLGIAVRTNETYWDAETQSWVLGRSHEITSVNLS